MLHLKLLSIIEHLLGNYDIFLVSPWWLIFFPSKWSPWDGFATGSSP
jgi:hypothetical protein